jgi:hypothetical protein
MPIRFLAAAAMFLFAGFAGVGGAEAEDAPTAPAASAAPAPSGTKYGATAFAYSLFGTALPCVASSIYISREGEASEAAAGLPILAAYLVGPSLGHFYAGQSKRALVGIGIRSAAAAAFAAGLSIEEDKAYDAPSANTLMLLSVIVGLSSTLVDVFDAPRSARIHNEGLPRTKIEVSPAAIGFARAPGIRVDASGLVFGTSVPD